MVSPLDAKAKEVVERLLSWGAPTKQRAKPLHKDAADLITAQAERIVELKRERDEALEPPLTCPAIDAFIARHDPDDAVLTELASIRHINSQLRYGTWYFKAMLNAAEAEVRTLREALDLYRDAVVVDVKMEGPRYMGANSSALKRAWDFDAALRAKEP